MKIGTNLDFTKMKVLQWAFFEFKNTHYCKEIIIENNNNNNKKKNPEFFFDVSTLNKYTYQSIIY